MHNTVARIRLCRAVALIIALGLIPASKNASAQQYTVASTESGAPRFLYLGHRGAPPIQVDVGSIPSLGRRIDLDLNDVTLEDALRRIETASGLQLIYSAHIVPLRRRVSLKASNLTVAAALTEVLFQTNVDLLLTDGRIVMVRGPKPPQVGFISGQVTDAKTKLPIRDATVTIEGTRLRTATSDSGRYRLARVPIGTLTLEVRRIGYEKATRVLTLTADQSLQADFELQPSARLLEQVVVTGMMTETARKAVPNAMQVISSHEIEERGITRIDQLFRGDVPGVIALNEGSSNNNGAKMYSRGGTSLEPLTRTPIKTYLDGVEMADPTYLTQIDPRSIERVEIITGPAATTIYGSNALTGVMQVFTKKGTLSKPSITVTLAPGITERVGAPGYAPEHDYSARVDGGTSGASYSAGSSYRYTGEWVRGYFVRDVNHSGSVRLNPEGVPITADVVFRVANRAFGLNGYAPWRVDQVMNGSFRFTPSSLIAGKWEGWRRSRGSTLGATLRYAASPSWDHQLTVGQDEIAFTQVSNAGYQNPADSLPNNVMESISTRPSAAYNTTLRYQFGITRLTTTAGADQWRLNSNSVRASRPATVTGSLSSATSFTVTRAAEWNNGYFVQQQINFADALFLTAGIRAEKNPNFGENHSVDYAPRYGVSYAAGRGSLEGKLRFAYGKATRPPSFGLKQESIIFDAAYGTFQVRRPALDLSPEYQAGTEGGLELYWRTRASFQLTRYDQTVSGLIAGVIVDSIRSINAPFTYRFITQSQNLGRVANRGWEAQGQVAVGLVTLRGTYSNTMSRVLSLFPSYNGFYKVGELITGLPEHSGLLGMTYANGGTVATFTTSFIGQRRTYPASSFAEEFSVANRARLAPATPQPEDQPGFTRLIAPYAAMDFSASRQVNAHINAFVQITNLTSQDHNDGDFTRPVRGRTTIVGTRFRW